LVLELLISLIPVISVFERLLSLIPVILVLEHLLSHTCDTCLAPLIIAHTCDICLGAPPDGEDDDDENVPDDRGESRRRVEDKQGPLRDGAQEDVIE